MSNVCHGFSNPQKAPLQLILVEFAKFQFQIDPSKFNFCRKLTVQIHSYIIKFSQNSPEKPRQLDTRHIFFQLISIHQSIYASFITKKENEEVSNYINFLPIKFKETEIQNIISKRKIGKNFEIVIRKC